MPSLLVAVVAVAGVLLAGSLLLEYRDDDADLEDAARRTGERAQRVTEGAARGSRIAVLGLAGLGASLAMEMLQLASGLNEILGGAPVIVGHLLFGLLAFLGVSGAIPLSVQQLGFAFSFITVIALVLRYGGDD